MHVSDSAKGEPNIQESERSAANARIAALYASHFKPLCAFLRKRMGDSDEIADIAQQAFCEAIKGYQNFNGQAALQTWVYGIALNLMRNYLAHARRAHQVSLDDMEMDFEDPAQVPLEKAIAAREELHHLSDLLDQCKDSNRAALMLIALEGLSYEEAAQRLHMADGTLRSKVSRLRSELRSGLQQPPHYENP